MRIALLCLGTQGDIRPFLAIATGLREEGHEVLVFTNAPNEKICVENGFAFISLAGNLAALVNPEQFEIDQGKIKLFNKLRRVIKEALSEQFDVLHDQLQRVDGVLYHPAVFAAEHVIEALGLPSLRIHFQPDIRSKYYPCCIFPPKMPFQRWSNWASHFIADQLFWWPLRGVINRWRTQRLGLSKLGILSPLSKEPFRSIPKVIAVSRTLVPPAPDWPDNVHVSGYLQLDKAADWIPSVSLQAFLQAGSPPVYIGFGSLTEQCDAKMSQAIIGALSQSSERFILCGPFLHFKTVSLPSNVIWIEAAPHDWLFPKMVAIVHHGGAGTTHAALSMGKPALVIPFVLDQFHWGEAIYRKGLGPKPLLARKLTQKAFLLSLEDLLSTRMYQTQAIDYARKMKEEKGVQQILHLVYEHFQETI